MFAKFFVDRPVFATVLSIVIVIIGLVALVGLPIAQYPEVVPPTVNVSATYPGASAKVVMKVGASAFRIAECRRYGGEVVLEPDFHAAFRRLDEIRDREGRTLIHPFEGIRTARGTGTLGL